MKAVIIGAGPVGCLLAARLRRRSFEVTVYERGPDPRFTPTKKRHSFNLTLSARGLSALEPWLRGRLEEQGVRLPQRVVHFADGTVSLQPYGIAENHSLLSVPRRVLHTHLIEMAERSGTKFQFGYKCISIDPHRPSVTLVQGNKIFEDFGDLLVGADGANSMVRRELAYRRELQVVEVGCDLGFVELKIPAARDEPHPLQLQACTTDPVESNYGLHVWPRGDCMLIAQPNREGSYSATLFLPLTSKGGERPSFEHLRGAAEVERFYGENFPDLVGQIPHLTEEFHDGPPAQLKTVRCSSFHFERTMLAGDAAHAMLPFYGQGINCSFEDVGVFLDLLDQNLRQDAGHRALSDTLAQYTAARKPQCDVIADLSQDNLRELINPTKDGNYDARVRLERELGRRYRERFCPLYCGVAFTTVPYREVLRQYLRLRVRLDDLCEIFDIGAEADRIIAAYPASATEGTEPECEPFGLELSPAQNRSLIERTVARILKYQSDLAELRYPASYVHDSVNVESYEAGRNLSAMLREDSVPTGPTDVDTLLSEIFDLAFAGGTVHPHPGFMAHIPSGGLFQGAVGDLIARTLNRFAGVWLAAPGLVQLESNVIRWFCSLLGYDRKAFGYLSTSGSISNLMGLMCALRRGHDSPSAGFVVYTSDQAHFSVGKAARLLGITGERLRIIRTGANYALDLGELVGQIKLDSANGLQPLCVIGTAGTTNTGAIDDLPGLAAVCRESGLYLHVDACFGGFFNLTERGRAALRGIEEADSIAVDPHKSLFLPHGISALLTRDPATLLNTFEAPEAGYIPPTPSQADLVNFCNYGLELSREIRGLSAWLPIKLHGIKAFQQCLDRTLDLAAYLADELERIDGVEVIKNHPILLPVVIFRLRGDRGGDARSLNERLCELICAEGHVYLTTTTLPDYGLVLRACILNHRTDQATVGQLLADLRSAILTLQDR